MDKVSKNYFINLIDSFSVKIEDVLIILEKVYNSELETAEDVTSLNLKLRNVLLSCIDSNLIFLTNDDRLLLTEYGQSCYIKLHQKFII